MAKEQATQQDYWNSRAEHFGDLGAPLIPGDQDIAFMQRQLVPGGNALILGVTPQLVSVALETSETVTAVDFAADMIKALGREGVRYVCADWNEYLANTPDKFDNIMTDAGLTCLEFPTSWQELAGNIAGHLRPNGIFAARAFINTSKPPKDTYDNPNLTRFISGMAQVDGNWMRQIDTHDDYRDFDVRYAFPPEEVVLQTFDQLELADRFVPDYEEGERFVSFAWRNPAA